MPKVLRFVALLAAVALLIHAVPATAQNCSVDHELLSFGAVLLGESSTRTLLVTNDGPDVLPLDLLAEPCAGDPTFTVLTTGHFDVSPGTSQAIEILYAPPSAGNHTCELDLGGNDCPAVMLSGWGQVYAEPQGNHIGLYRDATAQICQAPLDGAGMTVTLKILAVLPDYVEGVTAAEFRVDNLPASQNPPQGYWTVNWNTNLVIGNLIEGVALAFSEAQPGPVVELGTLVFMSFEQADWIGADHLLTVLPSETGALVVVDDAYNEIPIGGGRFTFNCADPPNCSCFAQGAPDCVVSTALLDFGEVPIGSAASLNLTVMNFGDAWLLGNVSESCEDFALELGAGFFALAPGETHLVRVRFLPNSDGPQSCTLDLGTEHCPEVLCTGTGYLALPDCDVSPPSLDFGEVLVGGSQALTFRIANFGEGLLEGDVTEDCVDLAVTYGAGHFVLGENSALYVTALYTPMAPGDLACTVDLGTEYCDPVEVVGTARLPIPGCAFEPDSLDFGDLLLGEALELDGAIVNTGETVVDGLIALNHPEFTLLSGGGQFTLAAGAVHDFRVRYAPVDTLADATVLTTDLPLCFELPLFGDAHDPTPICVLDPENVAFGELLIGDVSERELVVANEGDGPLELDLATGDPAFGFTGDPHLELAPGQTATVLVTFAPTSYGPQSSALVLGSAACAEVPLSGIGRNPSSGADHVGLFLDPGGTLCHADLAPFTHTTLYVLASVPSFASSGITGAEFRVNGIAALASVAEITADWTIPPVSGNLDQGLIFSFDAQPGDVVPLGVLDVYPLAELGDDRELRVARSLDHEVLSVTDVAGLGWDVGGGHFTINCSDGQPCDCLDFGSDNCSLSTTSIDFGQVTLSHAVYRNFTLTNTGLTALGGNMTISGQHFSLTEGEGPFLLEPGEVLNVVVRFYSGVIGHWYATVSTGLADCPEVLCHASAIGSPGETDAFIGIYGDALGVTCQADLEVYTETTLYLFAVLPLWLPAITAAEFSVEHLPISGPQGIRTDAWTTTLTIGEPATGIALAFNPPLSGPNALLGTMAFFELQADWVGQDLRLTVRESLDSGSLVVVGTDYVEYTCESGHNFTFNCTGNLPGGCSCVVALPVALNEFMLTDLAGAARLDWTLLGGGTPEFRLEGSRDGLSWLVPYDDLGAGRFTAEDHAAALGTAGAVTYTLYGREGDESWQLLRSESLAVAGVPQRTALLPAHPNPFNPQVTIPFSLGAAGPARLAIYDVSGRRVATLVDGTRPAGPQSAVWQGRDESGRSLGSGVYFVRLEAPGHSETQKLVLMR